MPGKADRVSLTFEADLGPLIKRLKEVPDLTSAEVRRATSALRRGTKQLQKDAKGVKDAAKTAGAGVKNLGETSGDAESSLRAVAGVIGLVSPEAEKALASVAELGGGLEGVTRAAGLFGGSLTSVLTIAAPVAAAVALLGAAHMMAARDVERAEKAMEAAAAAATKAQQVYGGTADVVRDLEDEFKILSGALSEQDKALADQQKAISQSFSQSRKSLERQIAALEKQKAAVRESGESIEEQARQRQRLSKLIRTQRDTLLALNKREERALFLAEANSELRAAEEAERKDVTSATKDQAAALRELASAQREVEQEAEEAMRAAGIELELRDRLAELRRDVTPESDRAKQVRAVNDEYRERLRTLEEIELLQGRSAETQDARAGIIMERQRQLAQIREDGEEEYRDLARETHQVLTTLLRQQEMARRQSLQNMGNALGTFAAGVADASAVAADKMAERNVEGAKRMFVVSKIAAIANTVIQGAMAAVGALAPPPFGLGPIAGGIAAAGIAATTAANVAIIASQQPSFNDTPGIMQLPSGGGVTLAPGDYMMAAKDLNDMQKQLDRATGEDRRPVVQVVAIPSYQGRTYERARRDAYRRPGSDYDRLAAGPRGGAGGW